MAVASIEDYKWAYRNYTLDELIKERNKVIKFIHMYENDEFPIESYLLEPNPHDSYLPNHECLIVICELIIEKLGD